jgi:hypothetical protein
MIDRYPRFVRSLNRADEDYAGNASGALRHVAEKEPQAFHVIELSVFHVPELPRRPTPGS